MSIVKVHWCNLLFHYFWFFITQCWITYNWGSDISLPNWRGCNPVNMNIALAVNIVSNIETFKNQVINSITVWWKIHAVFISFFLLVVADITIINCSTVLLYQRKILRCISLWNRSYIPWEHLPDQGFKLIWGTIERLLFLQKERKGDQSEIFILGNISPTPRKNTKKTIRETKGCMRQEKKVI